MQGMFCLAPRDQLTESVQLHQYINKRQTELAEFELKTINIEKLREIVKLKMKSKRAHRFDYIDSYSLKLAFPYIEKSLLHLVNLSIERSKFAKTWKNQLIIPLHKKKDKLEGSNYRPVSHIIEISKIVEYIVHEQVYQHFSLHNIFHPNHHGFLGCHNTATALIQLHDL